MVYVSTNAASPDPRTAIPTIITPRQMKDIRSSRMAIRGPLVSSSNHSAASFHDGFVRGRKWFRPPHWNVVRWELIETTGNLPPTIPVIRLGRGGGDPKSLNVAAWGAASSPQPLRGRVLRGSGAAKSWLPAQGTITHGAR